MSNIQQRRMSQIIYIYIYIYIHYNVCEKHSNSLLGLRRPECEANYSPSYSNMVRNSFRSVSAATGLQIFLLNSVNEIFIFYFFLMYKVVQIWPGLIVCKQVTVCPGHIWTTFYMECEEFGGTGCGSYPMTCFGIRESSLFSDFAAPSWFFVQCYSRNPLLPTPRQKLGCTIALDRTQ
jgi:hypothetical protein